jgi:hypothetical protein
MQRTEAYTYFTVPDGVTHEVYSFTYWCTVKLFLETAGPVAVGLRQDIAPVLSGRGVLLPSGGPEVDLEMQNGDRLYVVAGAVNRVRLIIVPEFLQEATEIIDKTTLSTVPGIVSGFAGAVRALLTGQAPTIKKPDQPICPPKLKPPRL